MKNKNRIKTRIIIPVALAIYILVTTFYVTTSQLMNYNVNRDVTQQFKAISNALNLKRADDINILTKRIFTIQNDKEIQKYWLSQNRKELLKRANIFYERTLSSFNITHFSFFDTNSVNFLHVHKSEKYTDSISKFTLKQAVESDIISSGLEVGSSGTFTLSVVVPWYINGKLEGYIELGEEIEHQLNAIHKIFGIDLFVLLKKDQINKSLYENRMKLLNKEAMWDKYSEYVLIYKSNDEIVRNPEVERLSDKLTELVYNDKNYMASAVAVQNAGFKQVAKIILLLDVTDSISSKRNAIMAIFVVSFIIGSLLLVFFYFILGRIERNLVEYEERAISEEKLRNLEQEKHISELRKEEKRIKISEERFKQVADYSNSIIWEINENKEYTYINSVVKKVLGYEPDELIGKNGYIHFPNCKENTISLEKQRKLLENDDKYQNLVFKFITKDGRDVWVRSSGAKIFDNNGKEIGRRGISTDITSLQESEMKLVEAKERAEKADNLKSTFLAQMSHEIRTPINSIVSLSSLVEDEFSQDADDDIALCFNLIHKSGDRIIRTTDLILNLSEVEAGTYKAMKEDFNLVDEVLNKLFNKYSPVAEEKSLKLKIDANIQNPIISADSYSVEQIFQNIIDNAIIYTDKGEVIIKVFEEGDKKIIVEIIDSGIGISEEYLPKLFTPFSQEMMGYTRKYEGNGVGLALVKKYCELNNATIEVESIKGEGSTFRVVFEK